MYIHVYDCSVTQSVHLNIGVLRNVIQNSYMSFVRDKEFRVM